MKLEKQLGETVVMVGEEPHKLRYRALAEGSLHLRSKLKRDDPDNVSYVEGEHYTVDYDEGTIRRQPGSSIPDWSEHPTYGKTEFNHSDYPDYSNRRFTLYTDYLYLRPDDGSEVKSSPSMPEALSQLRKKLEQGEAITYVVFGDSISTGAEASEESMKYYHLFAAAVRERFPAASIQVRMKAVGGESSQGGLGRLSRDVLSERPDLVTIGYGMNDQNRRSDGTNGVPPEQFERNISRMIDDIQQHTDASIILITPCLPNPHWKYASSNTSDYAEVLRKLGANRQVAVADLQQIWLEELSAGKTPESLLLNNVNHPNDYGHLLYARALKRLIPGGSDLS